MISFIRRMFSSFTMNSNKVALGRWRLDYCDKTLTRKIQMSNEDHCGVCINKEHYLNTNAPFWP